MLGSFKWLMTKVTAMSFTPTDTTKRNTMMTQTVIFVTAVCTRQRC